MIDMKKQIALIVSVLVLFSCTELEDFNKNIKDPSEVPGESLFTGAQKQLVDQMVSTNVNFNIFRLIMQNWTEVTYTDESNYDLVTRTIPEQHWEELYRDVLKDLDESAKIITAKELMPGEDPMVKANKLDLIEITNVYAWSILVETFGDVPYTDAIDIEKLLPKYDDAETIYTDLISRLNAVISHLEASTSNESFGDDDNLFQGDVSMWLKFANSLKLRMGLILADSNPTLAKTTVESAAPKVISSNDENALFAYGASQPNTNPLYVDLVASGRYDFVPSKTIIDTMNFLADPRRPLYFTEYNGAYVGGENGVENNYATNSHVADQIKIPTFKGDIMDYAEVEFLLAEAVERGFTVGGTAEAHYNNAIVASIEFWGGTNADAQAYLAKPEVAYTTAAGATWKEKIGFQAWLALYNRGFEAWTSWRKLDAPVIVAPPDAVSGTPVRLSYPIIEQTLNGTNYDAASEAIGGDAVETKLFWDKN
jgi:hypothetical protein